MPGFVFNLPIFQTEYHHISQCCVRKTFGSVVFVLLMLDIFACLFSERVCVMNTCVSVGLEQEALCQVLRSPLFADAAERAGGCPGCPGWAAAVNTDSLSCQSGVIAHCIPLMNHNGVVSAVVQVQQLLSHLSQRRGPALSLCLVL